MALPSRRPGRGRLAALIAILALAWLVGEGTAIVAAAVRDRDSARIREDSLSAAATAACRRHDDSVRASQDGGAICG